MLPNIQSLKWYGVTVTLQFIAEHFQTSTYDINFMGGIFAIKTKFIQRKFNIFQLLFFIRSYNNHNWLHINWRMINILLTLKEMIVDIFHVCVCSLLMSEIILLLRFLGKQNVMWNYIERMFYSTVLFLQDMATLPVTQSWQYLAKFEKSPVFQFSDCFCDTLR